MTIFCWFGLISELRILILEDVGILNYNIMLGLLSNRRTLKKGPLFGILKKEIFLRKEK